jgi:dipeptidase E
MKRLLLLSSNRFLEKNPQVFEKPFSKLKIAWIINASKSVPNTDYFERHRKFFKDHDYSIQKVDIDGKNKDELKTLLKDFEAVFVEGGNSFYLLKSIRESGFDEVVKELMPAGLIYIGASAGSYVACPTIEMALWKHQDKYNHHGITDYTAMNLVPFLMTAHYKPELKEILKDKIDGVTYPVKVLDDEQAILVIDEKIELIGKGEEIAL